MERGTIWTAQYNMALCCSSQHKPSRRASIENHRCACGLACASTLVTTFWPCIHGEFQEKSKGKTRRKARAHASATSERVWRRNKSSLVDTAQRALSMEPKCKCEEKAATSSQEPRVCNVPPGKEPNPDEVFAATPMVGITSTCCDSERAGTLSRLGRLAGGFCTPVHIGITYLL